MPPPVFDPPTDAVHSSSAIRETNAWLRERPLPKRMFIGAESALLVLFFVFLAIRPKRARATRNKNANENKMERNTIKIYVQV